MFKKLTSALSSTSSAQAEPSHRGAVRTEQYAALAKQLAEAGVPVDISDCAICEKPCPVGEDQGPGAGTIIDAGLPWDGKPYDQYVENTYGDFDFFPSAIDTDWDSALPGSGGCPRGRVVVVSTGKSDWEHNHLVSNLTPSPRNMRLFTLTLSLTPGRKRRVRKTNRQIRLDAIRFRYG